MEQSQDRSYVLAILKPSKNLDNKYIVQIGKKQIEFGQRAASDFTIHKNPERKQLYINRHIKRESRFWDFNNEMNYLTPSFYSRYVLWEKDNIMDSIKHIEDNTDLRFKFTKNTIERHQKTLARESKKNDDQD